jgi:tRNA(Ile)-lysidine synthase
VDEESNFSHDYTRNFIRNSVFPEIRKKFPDYENALIRLSDNAREDNELIESMSVKPDVSGDKTSIPVDALGAHKSVVRRSVMRCFNALGIYADIERRHIDLIIKLKDLPNGSALDMPYDVKAHREYDKIVFAINRSVINEKLAEFVTGGIVLNGTAINVSPYKDEGLRFDLDKVPGSAVIRYRKEGDYFTKFGGGTKSLSDYMTDIKIPKRERDYIPLVAAGSEVLIVIGYEISDKVRVDKETKNIYTISAGVQDEQ